MTAARQLAASGNYLFFDVGEYRFCAPVNDVEAIVELSGIHRLPVAPKGIAGTVLFRGQLAVVCDLGEMLNVAVDAARKDLSVVVKLPIGLIAFRVDHVSDIVAASEVRPQKADERAMKDWMDGYVMQGPNIAFLTTFEKLLRLFGVSSFANLKAVAEAVGPGTPERAQTRAVAGDAAPQPVASMPKEMPAAEKRAASVARVATESREEPAVRAMPEIAAARLEPPAPDDSAAVVAAAPQVAELREFLSKESQPSGESSEETIGAAIEPDAVSPQAEFEPPIDAESAPEFPAHEPEPVAQAAAEFLVASPAEIADSQGHAPQAEQAGEKAPFEFPMRLDTAAQDASVEPVLDGGRAPEAIDIEADLSTRYAAYPEAEVASDAVSESEAPPASLNDEWREPSSDESLQPLGDESRQPPSDESRGSLWEEAARGSPEAEPLASLSQESEDHAVSEAESAAVAQSGMQGEAGLVDRDDIATRDTESWTGSEHAPSSRTSPEKEGATLRRNSVWRGESEPVLGNAVSTNDSAIYSGEPEPAWKTDAAHRARSAPTVLRPDSGRRLHAALSIVAVVVLAAIVVGWWWLVSPRSEQKAEVRRPAEAAAPQSVASGPIEKRTEALEIVGKDFELRVEPAAPGKAESPRAPAAPTSRDEFVHVVVRGDTLWDIAAKHLGNPYRYPELARNSEIRNPDLIHPGDVVRIRKLR